VNATDRDIRLAVMAGTVASASMIAFQIAGKATRDALFLSTYDIVALPAMVMGASALSLILAGLASRAGGRLDPARVVPQGFALSAMLTLGEWSLVGEYRGAVAIIMYLHFTGLGALLISGFWSVVSERFDPRTAKRQIARIAVGGTVGGLLGGIMAERGAALLGIEALFPMLALLHVLAAVFTSRMGRTIVSPALTAEFTKDPEASTSGLQVLRRSPYLTTIGSLVLLTAVAEGLLDLSFKAWASYDVQGEDLLRLFAVFYTATALITVLVQTLATKKLLQRLGLAVSAAGLPTVVALGAGGVVLFPGLITIMLARGSESVMRNSLYRSAYELLFNPVNALDRRIIKPILDVGFVRTGDLAAGALAQIVVFLSADDARGLPIYVLTFILAVAAMGVARRLHRGYLKTLEKSLVVRGSYLEEDGSSSVAQTAIMQTLGAIDLTQFRETTSDDRPSESADADDKSAEVTSHAVPLDPVLMRAHELRSRDRMRVTRALTESPLTLELVPLVVPLLAWDEVARAAMKALRPLADRATGLFTDYLIDPDSDFSIRRRLPLVLTETTTQRAADGLLAGLEDRRFEVRYRCGRVLSRMHARDGSLRVDRAHVLVLIDREVAVDRGVWESRRLLDATEDEDKSPILDEALRDRADRSLEHVFTMLSLILPAEPLRVAFRGIFTDDALLRGTALEYLESALPVDLRHKLWPFLEKPIRRGRKPPPSDDALQGLLHTDDTLADRLEALKRLREESED
jgi:AAA family ATP:ADP antiporter